MAQKIREEIFGKNRQTDFKYTKIDQEKRAQLYRDYVKA